MLRPRSIVLGSSIGIASLVLIWLARTPVVEDVLLDESQTSGTAGTQNTSQSFSISPYFARLPESQGGPKHCTSRPADTDEAEPLGVCVFIDTHGGSGETTREFYTWNVFETARCTWEVWHFGPVNSARALVIGRLQKIGVRVRLFRPLATAKTPPLSQTQAKERYDWDVVDENETDVAGLMLANLRPHNFVMFTVHADIELAQGLVDSGAAALVDKWFFDTGFNQKFRLTAPLREVIESGVPGIKFTEFPDSTLVRAAKRVTHLGIRQDASYAAKQARFFAPIQRRIFVDLGMNHGDTIYQFLTFVSDPQNWEVWGWEANPPVTEQAVGVCHWIIQNYPVRHENIHILNAAAWIENSTLSFNTGHANAGSVFAIKRQAGVEVVPAVDMVSWIRGMFTNRDFIFLKMDIEGAEYPVLARLLRDGVACWPRKWGIEWHHHKAMRISRLETGAVQNAFRGMCVENGAVAVGLE